jgi:hypothetical protein
MHSGLREKLLLRGGRGVEAEGGGVFMREVEVSGRDQPLPEGGFYGVPRISKPASLID